MLWSERPTVRSCGESRFQSRVSTRSFAGRRTGAGSPTWLSTAPTRTHAATWCRRAPICGSSVLTAKAPAASSTARSTFSTEDGPIPGRLRAGASPTRRRRADLRGSLSWICARADTDVFPELRAPQIRPGRLVPRSPSSCAAVSSPCAPMAAGGVGSREGARSLGRSGHPTGGGSRTSPLSGSSTAGASGSLRRTVGAVGCESVSQLTIGRWCGHQTPGTSSGRTSAIACSWRTQAGPEVRDFSRSAPIRTGAEPGTYLTVR